jgi:transcription antitermination factor NusG
VSDGAKLSLSGSSGAYQVISPTFEVSANNASALPSSCVEMKWYAAYTSANHEKKVRQQLELRHVESFLPLYETVRRWKDRRMRLQLPLFPGYVFARMALPDRLQVLQVPGVVRLVGFNGRPAPLLDEEIEGLRKGLTCGVLAEPHPFLTIGRRVRIKGGPLAGREGVLLRKKGALRVVLSILLIRRSVVVDVDEDNIAPVTSGRSS